MIIKSYNLLPLSQNAGHVWLITATDQDDTIEDFFRLHDIDKILAEKGALLFRRFGLKTDDDFSKLVNRLAKKHLVYKERSTQRQKTGDGVYTSTEYPSHKIIANHSENSFQQTVPGKILFFAKQACTKGGETPLGDNIRMLDLLGPEIVETFKRRKICYLRNFDGGFDLSWQEAFQTNNPQDVEEYCRRENIEFEWISKTHLRTRQIRSAIRCHPLTGKEVWFNQLHLFHITNLDYSVREALLKSLGSVFLPRHALYGNGDEIPTEIVEFIRDSFMKSELVFPWVTGDVLIADNFLVSHGRKAFAGERAIRVALIDPVEN